MPVHKRLIENDATYEFILTELGAVNRCEISHLLAVRRKKSGEREKQGRSHLPLNLLSSRGENLINRISL
ncbi:hypothetical protein QUB70_09555 [Microcoleus sp. A003_D6]